MSPHSGKQFSTVGHHSPWRETISHCGKSFSTMAFPVCPSSRNLLGASWVPSGCFLRSHFGSSCLGSRAAVGRRFSLFELKSAAGPLVPQPPHSCPRVQLLLLFSGTANFKWKSATRVSTAHRFVRLLLPIVGSISSQSSTSLFNGLLLYHMSVMSMDHSTDWSSSQSLRQLWNPVSQCPTTSYQYATRSTYRPAAQQWFFFPMLMGHQARGPLSRGPGQILLQHAGLL